MVAIIDYDAGNIKSVEKAFEALGAEVSVTSDPEVIRSADHVVLPGVGAFGDAMNKLNNMGLTEVIREVAKSGKPFLGICLGLQLLFDSSEEAPGVEGLGILPGKVLRFKEMDGLKIPQIGWNALHLSNNGRLFSGVDEGAFVYFVHSYYLDAADRECVKATAEYGVSFDASVEHDNIFACQFHPEKSSSVGLKMLENFLKISM